tara:strand:+ start:400 stop:972 length:573 start_codon:yes stop_codon:yes gene_type:complete
MDKKMGMILGGGVGLVVIIVLIFALSGGSTKDKLVGTWSATSSGEVMKISDDGTDESSMTLPLPGMPDMKEFGIYAPGVTISSTWTLSEDDKTITSKMILDKDLTDRMFRFGLGQEMGISRDGSLTYVTEITSITDDELCGKSYLLGEPQDFETECYVRIDEEKYSSMTKGYISFDSFINQLLDLVEQMQ